VAQVTPAVQSSAEAVLQMSSRRRKYSRGRGEGACKESSSTAEDSKPLVPGEILVLVQLLSGFMPHSLFLTLEVVVGHSHHVVQAGDCANIGCIFFFTKMPSNEISLLSVQSGYLPCGPNET